MLDRYNIGCAALIMSTAILSRVQQLRFGELSEDGLQVWPRCGRGARTHTHACI